MRRWRDCTGLWPRLVRLGCRRRWRFCLDYAARQIRAESDDERWARWLWEKFGIRPHPPVEYQLVVRHDVLAIPCVGVERVEP